MRAIFISYRRDDSEGQAGRIFDDLTREFGADSVFMDVAAIEPGRDFRRAIDQHVASCGVLLAVIGRNWAGARNESGQRRLDDPLDFVRLETAAALRRDIPVAPVLVQGAAIPRVDELPEDLRDLSFRAGIQLTHAHWDSDIQVLVKALRPYLQPTKPPTAIAADGAAPSNRWRASRTAIAAMAGVAVLAVAGYVWRINSGSGNASATAEVKTVRPTPANAETQPVAIPPTSGDADRGTQRDLVESPPSPEDVSPGPRRDPARRSLVGVWHCRQIEPVDEESPCRLDFNKDDGKDIEATCVTSIVHRLSGSYVSADSAEIIFTRTNGECVLRTPGTLTVRSDNEIEVSSGGWFGCDVKTPTGETRARCDRLPG